MITHISLSETVVPRYEKFELTFQLTGTWDDPFDVRDVEVWAVFTGPGPAQTENHVPGFYYQQFEVLESDVGEQLAKVDDPQWKVRFAPSDVGEYQFRIFVRYQQQPPVGTSQMSFECTAGDSPGFIRRSGRHFLRFDDDSTYLPIGHNLSWDDATIAKTMTAWFADRLAKMSAVGENWTRIWMTNWAWHGLAIEWSPLPYAPGYGGVGQYSLQSAWKLDQVVELVERSGIAAQLVIEPHANLKDDKHHDWVSNPYNRQVEGGFLNKPGEFFSHSEARRLFRQRLRYIVARWSYSTGILAWELFNEVQNIDEFADHQQDVIQWHEEMADYLRATDPLKHLITTSSHVSSIASVWSIAAIDLVQPHLYSPGTMDAIEDSCRTLEQFEKPLVIGEFGADVCNVTYPEDNLNCVPEPLREKMKAGLHFHNGMWCATFHAATAQLWWWDYIDALDLYDQFTPLVEFWDGETLDDDLVPADVSLINSPMREQLWIATGPLDFFDQAAQSTFTVSVDGSIAGRENIHPYLHGAGQAHLKTDPSFSVSVNGGQFRIHWDDVAEKGAVLEILVDDQIVARSELSRGRKCQTMTLGDLPSGPHRIQVRNTGRDWVLISSYEFTHCPHPAIKAHGLADSTRAFLWLTDVGNQLYSEATHSPFERVSAELRGLQDGDYLMQVYGTQPGSSGILSESTVAGVNGRLAFELPSFTHDIAAKFKLQ